MSESESPTGWKLWEAEIRPRREKGMGHAAIAAELGLDPGYVADLDRSWSTPHAVATGPELFRDLKDAMAQHYFLEQPWHYVIAALFVMQAYVASVLPVVFYLFIGGSFGSGKTNFLSLIRLLTDGLFFENVSVAALARTMTHGRTVCMDEIDVDRGKDFNEIRDAFLRQGYKADAAPYVRWDASKKAKEEIPVYGPRCAAYRGALEDALQSRGFALPSVKPEGPEGFAYVLRNFWPDLGDLPVRLKMWGEDARAAFPPKRLQEIASSESFREKITGAVEQLGANRDSELGSIAMLIAEMAGVDVLGEIREANKLRDVAMFAASDSDLDELHGAVLDVAGPIQDGILDKAPHVPVRQAPIRKKFNERRKASGERPISNRAFARLRREAGVKDEWIVHGKTGGLVWNLPLPYLRYLRTSDSLPMEGSEVTEVTEVGRAERVYDEDIGPIHPDRRKDAALRKAQAEATRDEPEDSP
jgi:hypothetical protein